MASEVIPMEIVHKSFVTWDKGFGGHATELTIVQHTGWAEVFLKGGGYSDEWAHVIHHCPIDVLREIVRMHDALPPMPAGTPRPTHPKADR